MVSITASSFPPYSATATVPEGESFSYIYDPCSAGGYKCNDDASDTDNAVSEHDYHFHPDSRIHLPVPRCAKLPQAILALALGRYILPLGTSTALIHTHLPLYMIRVTMEG